MAYPGIIQGPVLYPRILQELTRVRPKLKIVLQTPVDEVLALWGDILGNGRPLQIRQPRLQGQQDISLTIEAVAPRILPS